MKSNLTTFAIFKRDTVANISNKHKFLTISYYGDYGDNFLTVKNVIIWYPIDTDMKLKGLFYRERKTIT